MQLYTNSIESELERNRFITLLIAGDPNLHTILRKNNEKILNQYVQNTSSITLKILLFWILMVSPLSAIKKI